MCGGSVGSPWRSCVVSLCCTKSYGVSPGDTPTSIRRRSGSVAIRLEGTARECRESVYAAAARNFRWHLTIPCGLTEGLIIAAELPRPLANHACRTC